jgi:hypothetical protein
MRYEVQAISEVVFGDVVQGIDGIDIGDAARVLGECYADEIEGIGDIVGFGIFEGVEELFDGFKIEAWTADEFSDDGELFATFESGGKAFCFHNSGISKNRLLIRQPGCFQIMIAGFIIQQNVLYFERKGLDFTSWAENQLD